MGGRIGIDGLAAFENGFGVDGGEEVHEAGDDPGPAGLMAGAEAGAVVAVEVFVELKVIAPVRIVLEFLDAAVDRTPAVFVLEENARSSGGVISSAT